MTFKTVLERIKAMFLSTESGVVWDMSSVHNALDRIIEMLKDTHGEMTLPDMELEALARTFLPDILAFFSSPEGKAEYEKWQKEKAEINKDDRKETA